MNGAHLSIDGVTHRYRRNHQPAVAGVSFQVEPGEALALVGRSGCGKSTLLHILSGLVAPSDGVVRVDGLRVDGPSPKWVVMFQQPSLYPWMTVAENIALGLRFTGRSKEVATRVPELLRLVELESYGARNVQDLSGGQQQRVALARSLAPRPEILFLDEPFSALDAFTRQSLQRDVRRIAKDLGITLVLVTHDLAEAARMADRTVVLSADPGRVRAIVPIEREDPDDPLSAPTAAALGRLAAAYEAAAGRRLERGDAPDLPAAALPQRVAL